ncbi:hypothetical protein ACJIZ3_009066 [Penstemon smallii]|uniref:Glutamine cyclotransferase n=1 Tax=Penstemon smallii TaxID=265156 RepID=A0ABD3TCB2_9LAMI
MPIKSLRRKSNGRKSNSNPRNPQNNTMAPSTTTSFRLTYRHASFLISAFLFISVLILLSISWNTRSVIGSHRPLDPICGIEVVNEFPHDPNAFTQGLLYAGNDTFFESTGLYGRSSVRKVALGTGKVEAIQNLHKSYFGEGLTLLGERLFQVTWLKKTAFIYDSNNLSKVEMFTNPMPDGWGLATDGKVLFGSDGTSTLYAIDPQSLKVVKRHIVRYKGHEVHNLNELEYVNGEVWANVWQTDCIARISGKDGVVLGWIYLPNLREGLVAAENRGIDVLNGIAWDQGKNRLFLTGKLWPKLYEIKLRPQTRFNGDIEKLCMHMPFQF